MSIATVIHRRRNGTVNDSSKIVQCGPTASNTDERTQCDERRSAVAGQCGPEPGQRSRKRMGLLRLHAELGSEMKMIEFSPTSCARSRQSRHPSGTRAQFLRRLFSVRRRAVIGNARLPSICCPRALLRASVAYADACALSWRLTRFRACQRDGDVASVAGSGRSAPHCSQWLAGYPGARSTAYRAFRCAPGPR